MSVYFVLLQNRALPENLFDIQVFGPQNNLIYEYVAPEDGITFDNLQPGLYTVKEIKHDDNVNRLGIDANVEAKCKGLGFTDGGFLHNLNAEIESKICFEYVEGEDEQRSDCSTITLAAGESRTCTVKNYINFAQDIDPRV